MAQTTPGTGTGNTDQYLFTSYFYDEVVKIKSASIMVATDEFEMSDN